MAWQVGDKCFSHRTMLAPMEGVTHSILRADMASRPGLGIVCTEFIRITSAKMKPSALRREVAAAPGAALSVQVMGNDVARMAEAAAIVAAAGADVVDINLGCPAPRVVRKGVGAAMLKDLALLHRVLSAMRESVPGLLSAKVRAGFDDAEQVLDIARAVEDAGADFIVVHPRTRKDGYRGVADWRPIAAIKGAVAMPVVGNGDVWYAADALRMRAETGCDAVMIGRPALRNPWIFQQVAELEAGAEPFRPTGDDVWRYLAQLLGAYRRAFPGHERGPIGKAKELLRYLARAVDDGGVFLRAVLRINDFEGILRCSEAAYRSVAVDRLDLGAYGDLGLERSGTASAAIRAA